MKTIEEIAKEYADSLLDREADLLEWHCRYNGYEAGYEACNAEWEEKTRWIPVTERLPEDIVKIRTVVADNYRTEEVIVRCTEGYPDSPILTRIMLRAKYYYNGNSEWRWVCPNNTIVIEWKQII